MGSTEFALFEARQVISVVEKPSGAVASVGVQGSFDCVRLRLTPLRMTILIST
jgi:hypothetical protein